MGVEVTGNVLKSLVLARSPWLGMFIRFRKDDRNENTELIYTFPLNTIQGGGILVMADS